MQLAQPQRTLAKMAICYLVVSLLLPLVALAQTPTVSLLPVQQDTPLFESSGMSIDAWVVRDGDTTSPLPVQYSISGSARNGVDYEVLSGTVMIPAGETAAIITIRVINDSIREEPEFVELRLEPITRPFTLAILPDTQCYSGNIYGGTPQMFTSQTQWIADHKEEKNIAFVLHEGDCTEFNELEEWQRVKASMRLLDGVTPYAIAVGNHDGLHRRLADTALFNQFFPLTNYQHLPTFGGVFESNRLDNSYHFFTAGGVDWLVLSLEFGPRNEVLNWANTVVTNFPNRKVIVVTHSHVFHDDTLHGSSLTHDWTPATYNRTNNGVEVWEKFIRHHANMAFVFNGHILGDGQGRLVGIGDHGNRVYQMLCNYQMKAHGGAGFLRYLTFYPEEDRVEAKSYSPFLNRSLVDVENEFEYRNLGIFSNAPPPYVIDAQNNMATIGIFSDEIDTSPPGVLSVAAFGNPAEITVLFDEVVEQITAESWTNYSINSTVPIISAVLASDFKTVILTCQTSLVPMATYTLTITGIKDVSAFENEITTPVSWPFLYSPVLLDDDFTDFNFDGWTIVDEGTNNAPSIWTIVNGRMFQYSNIHSPLDTNSISRLGTFAYWDKLRAFSWNNYVASVTLKNTDDDGIGFMFRYQDPSNFYKIDFDAQHSFRRLSKMVGGVETQLAIEHNGFPVNRDAQLRVRAFGNEITATLDGVLLFGGPVTDESFTNGTIALSSYGSSGASFDNVLITLSNSVPEVSITSPPDHTTYKFGTPITFAADATDADSLIASVEFFHGNVLVGRITNAPYSFVWTNVPAGNHVITARATDIFDAVGNSSPRHVQIGAAPPVFLRQPQDRVAHMSHSVFFSAKVSGTPPLSYQWFFNDLPITNATTPILILNNVEENRAGTYFLRVESPEVTVLSSPVSLEIVPEENAPVTNSSSILRVEEPDFTGHPVFSLVGLPGRLEVQFSADLRTWSNLVTLTNTTSRLFFDDANPSRERRFYRVVNPH